MKTITVNGFGAETAEQRAQLYLAKQKEVGTVAKDRDEFARIMTEWVHLFYASYEVVDYHNGIAAPAIKYAMQLRIVGGRVAESEAAYEELDKRTTTAWHAAHHRFVLAATEARNALAELVENANELCFAASREVTDGLRKKYQQMVPAEDRLPDPIDLPSLRTVRADLDEFVELTRERFQLAAHTLAGTIPAGFEPAAGTAPTYEHAASW